MHDSAAAFCFRFSKAACEQARREHERWNMASVVETYELASYETVRVVFLSFFISVYDGIYEPLCIYPPKNCNMIGTRPQCANYV